MQLPICRKYTADELNNSQKVNRKRLIAEHNLHICMAEIDTVKHAIVEGSLWDLVERRSHGHPSMASALKHLSFYREDLEKGTRIQRAWSFYYGAESLVRPEITKHQRLLLENYKKPENTNSLLLITPPPHNLQQIQRIQNAQS